ncbi:hypothetical protein BU25DRAFT_461049 [Macroventuria anomochaeta]|uniref:Uncharacterized protein n=1 Tax=Macroventuria anomochaeta TaxID=301207 RepID=A0ACB6RUE8_9PLEO|nr:uncharacterized protein BU25DRAFT_461049 [Macroventuria anomochaeta]KAF2624517.1 hypothetical protein BU25DRAFT_461049 [Macroventuria anomochaeta]
MSSTAQTTITNVDNNDIANTVVVGIILGVVFCSFWGTVMFKLFASKIYVLIHRVNTLTELTQSIQAQVAQVQAAQFRATNMAPYLRQHRFARLRHALRRLQGAQEIMSILVNVTATVTLALWLSRMVVQPL